MPKKPAVMDYDPNIRWSTQKVRLVFGRWKYRAEMVVDVGGNCLGLTIMESAVQAAATELLEKEYGPDEYPDPHILLKWGDRVLVCDYEGDSEWLQELLISAEIISIAPEKA